MEIDVGTVLGNYTVTGIIGRGGMGAVFRAVQAPLGREVALKVIRTDVHREEDLVERFRREAASVSTIAHPNVVTLYEFGEKDGQLYLAMELIRGETVRERLRKQGAFTPVASLPIIRDIAAGLAEAHKHGILHRDLKPDNVMLVDASGRRDLAKLLDFGVARIADGSMRTSVLSPEQLRERLLALPDSSSRPRARPLTQVGSLVGTPGYVAPECVSFGSTDDPRIDLYALGVVWFEMLSGRPLFDAPTPLAIVLRHVTERAPRLDTVDASFPQQIPKAVVDLVDSLLDRDPEGRPPSANALLTLLDSLHPSTPPGFPVSTGPWSDPSLPTMDDTIPPELAIAATRLSMRPLERATATPMTTSLTQLKPPLARSFAWAFAGAGVALVLAILVTLLVTRAVAPPPPAPPPPAPAPLMPAAATAEVVPAVEVPTPVVDETVVDENTTAPTEPKERAQKEDGPKQIKPRILKDTPPPTPKPRIIN